MSDIHIDIAPFSYSKSNSINKKMEKNINFLKVNDKLNDKILYYMKDIKLNLEDYINDIDYKYILSEVFNRSNYYKIETGVSIINLNRDFHIKLIELKKKFNSIQLYIDIKNEIRYDINDELSSLSNLLISTDKESLKNRTLTLNEKKEIEENRKLLHKRYNEFANFWIDILDDDETFKLFFNKITSNDMAQIEKKIKMLCEKIITITNFYNYLYFNTYKDHITLETNIATDEKIYDYDVDLIIDSENDNRQVTNYNNMPIINEIEKKIKRKQKNFKEFNKIILKLWKDLLESIKIKEKSVSESSSKSIKISSKSIKVSSKSGGSRNSSNSEEFSPLSSTSEKIWTSSPLSSTAKNIQTIIDNFLEKIINNYETDYEKFYIKKSIKNKKIKETKINLNIPLVLDNNSSLVLNNNSIITIVDEEEIKKNLKKIKINESQINRLIETYNTTLNKQLLIENNEKINKKFKDAFDTNQSINEDIIDVSDHSIISLFARFIKFDGDIKFNDYKKINNITRKSFYYVINRIFDGDDLIRTYGIDDGGLRRVFITNLTTELFSKKIFITQSGNAQKYFLNPEYRLDEKDIFIIKNISNAEFRNDKLNHWKIFYSFLAKLVSFILVNDCGLEHKLSLGLITHIIKEPEEIKDEDYLYFLLDDFPDIAKGLYNLKEEEIETAELTYNSTYYLNKTDDEITKENYKKYLIKTSKFLTRKMILRKEIDYVYNNNDRTEEKYNRLAKYGEFIFESFINGIPKEIKETFKNIPIKTVETYLTPSRLTLETIKLLIENVKTNTQKIISNLSNIEKKNALQDTLNIFVEKILLNSTNKPLDIYLDYIEKLLRFWSGLSIYKKNEKYKIDIDFVVNVENLPVSHTCYFEIDFPDYKDIQNKTKEEILVNKMDLAIHNVEIGIGMAGGNKKKSKKIKM